MIKLIIVVFDHLGSQFEPVGHKRLNKLVLKIEILARFLKILMEIALRSFDHHKFPHHQYA